MPQSYTNLHQSVLDVNITNLVAFTKLYSKTQRIGYLKNTYNTHAIFFEEQIELFDKAQKKLPSWVAKGCYFTRKSLEQCSSIPLANFKTNLFLGDVLVDLSAGLGVDDVAFANSFKQVIGVDPDKDLNQIVRFNFNKLGVTNIIRVDAKAEDYLSNNTQIADAYYIDADRRPTSKVKTFSLVDATPNVLAIVPKLVDQGSTVLLKLSPMVDIAYLFKTFANIEMVYVVGLKNEVKEVLVVMHKNALSEHQNIRAIQVNEQGEVECQFPENAVLNQADVIGVDYFYEPSNMVIKAGLSVNYANACGIDIVAKNSHYCTANFAVNNYFGRMFKVINHQPFSKTTIKQYLKTNQITKANISARNFVTTVDELRKTFALTEGGDDYIFCTTNAAKNKLFWHCKKN